MPHVARRAQTARPTKPLAPRTRTRDYVKKVMANAWFYTHRLTGRTASLRALMGTVPGRDAGETANNVAAIP